MMRKNGLVLLLFAFLSTWSIPGCGGSSTEPQETESSAGSFELSYSGDASGTISGRAIFDDSSPLPDGTTAEVFLAVGRVPGAPSDSDSGFQLGRISPPGQTGTYELTAFDGVSTQDFGLEVVDETDGMSVQASDGTITFTEVSPSRVQGRFTATLTGRMTGSQDITVSATGTFDAPRCDFIGVVGEVECD